MVVLGLCTVDLVRSQTERPYQRTTLTLTVGAGSPISHEGITEFWNGGVNGSMMFLVNVNRSTAFGLGIDGTRLPFDEPAFQQRFPAVEVRSQDIGIFNLFVMAKYAFRPLMRFSPFVSLFLGATRVTSAVYIETVNGVRQYYYNIPTRTRFSAGASIGADISVASWLWLEAEVKTTYVHGDADLGLMLCARGGIVVRL